MEKYAINAQCNIPEQSLKAPKKENCIRPKRTVRIESSKIRLLSGQSDGRLELVRGSQRH
jgi:hypothetical protein